MKPKTHEDWLETFIEEMNEEIKGTKERVSYLEERRDVLTEILKKEMKPKPVKKLGF